MVSSFLFKTAIDASRQVNNINSGTSANIKENNIEALNGLLNSTTR